MTRSTKKLLPPLPEVKGKELILAIYSHRSVQHFGGNETADRLALLGRQVVKLAVTNALYLKNYSASGMNCEAYLTETAFDLWAREGKLKDHVRYAENAAPVIDSLEESRHLFEAYMGGVFTEGGLSPVQSWITLSIFEDGDPPGYGASASQAQSTPLPSSRMTSPTPGPSSANLITIALINQTASQKHVDLKWEPTSTGPPHAPTWTVTCIVDGVIRGTGVSANAKDAKIEAAQQAWRALGW